MGRWSYSNRQKADSLKKVEIWWLKKYGYLNGWKYGSIQWTNSWSENKSSVGLYGSTLDNDKFIRFQYTQTDRDTGEKQEFDYKVQLISTPCNYGGMRYWFICPLWKSGVYCGRRVGVLYKAGDYFGCRHCYNLTYSSKNRSKQGKYYYLSRIIDDGEKIDKIKNSIKRWYYAGKPTKKHRKLIRIDQNLEPYAKLLLRGK